MHPPRLRPILCQLKAARLQRSISTSKPVVELAYDLYEPESSKKNPGAPKNAPVLFLHGLFGSKKNNRSMSKVLARDLDRPVYALDLRNHGNSPHSPHHDYTALASDVEAFINTHNLHNSTLIGHSMGAKTAMCVALRSPSKVANLIPVDNAPVDAALKSDFNIYVKGMMEVERAKVKKQSEADEILKPYAKELAVRQFLLTNLMRAKDGPHMIWRVPLNYLAAALDDMADFPYRDPDEIRYEKPTLFLRGTKSHYIPDETLPIIGRFFPLFKVADIEAGHWVISENPEGFRRAVVEFLQDKD
ncbi:alpha/beta-hydrolase [Tothia fuscella]|uniref:Alpha/beta-hydrolase n=1 Tax=Tothia fuscella TaxID=1048955 RepID=A0A9P4TUQ3_9PEZI|nr:alpha/beta-hydrolase [Tothia fuscella]